MDEAVYRGTGSSPEKNIGEMNAVQDHLGGEITAARAVDIMWAMIRAYVGCNPRFTVDGLHNTGPRKALHSVLADQRHDSGRASGNMLHLVPA